jgi:hypothetical protein
MVLEPWNDEHHDGKPKGHDFACTVPRGESEHHCHADKSICGDGTQENVNPRMTLCLAICEIANKGKVGFFGKELRFVGEQNGTGQTPEEVGNPNYQQIEECSGRRNGSIPEAYG